MVIVFYLKKKMVWILHFCRTFLSSFRFLTFFRVLSPTQLGCRQPVVNSVFTNSIKNTINFYVLLPFWKFFFVVRNTWLLKALLNVSLFKWSGFDFTSLGLTANKSVIDRFDVCINEFSFYFPRKNYILQVYQNYSKCRIILRN